MSKEFNNILDECLERLLVKGETIEQCLQSYPEQAAELRPLLQTALATKEASAIQPRAEFKARARYQFHSALQEAASRRGRPSSGWLPRWAAVATVIVGLLLAGSGTVAAANYSMPDSTLYPLKLTTENVQLTLTRSDTGKAELNAMLADRRVAEIIYMARKGDAQQVEVATQRLDKCLVTLACLASPQEAVGTPRVPTPQPESVPPKEALTSPTAPSPPPEPALVPAEEATGEGGMPAKLRNRAKLRMAVAHSAVNHPEALRAALEKAPESAKPALRRAIAVSVAGYDRALEALD